MKAGQSDLPCHPCEVILTPMASALIVLNNV